jgi:hypothetical protein
MLARAKLEGSVAWMKKIPVSVVLLVVLIGYYVATGAI